MNLSYVILIIGEICGIAVIHNWGWRDKPGMIRAKRWAFTIVLSLLLLLEAVGVIYFIE